MKCKHCSGTGYDDTQRGTVMTEFPPCPWCGGSGYVKDKEQTNEEWFGQLRTSAKSAFMATVVVEAIKEYSKCGATRFESVIWWEEWLKEKHNEV